MKRLVEVHTTTFVVVEVDETKFTPEFDAEFAARHWPVNGVDGHIKQLAELAANGELSDSFDSAYGDLANMGIKTHVVETMVSFLAYPAPVPESVDA